MMPLRCKNNHCLLATALRLRRDRLQVAEAVVVVQGLQVEEDKEQDKGQELAGARQSHEKPECQDKHRGDDKVQRVGIQGDTSSDPNTGECSPLTWESTCTRPGCL